MAEKLKPRLSDAQILDEVSRGVADHFRSYIPKADPYIQDARVQEVFRVIKPDEGKSIIFVEMVAEDGSELPEIRITFERSC